MMRSEKYACKKALKYPQRDHALAAPSWSINRLQSCLPDVPLSAQKTNIAFRCLLGLLL